MNGEKPEVRELQRAMQELASPPLPHGLRYMLTEKALRERADREHSLGMLVKAPLKPRWFVPAGIVLSVMLVVSVSSHAPTTSSDFTREELLDIAQALGADDFAGRDDASDEFGVDEIEVLGVGEDFGENSI